MSRYFVQRRKPERAGRWIEDNWFSPDPGPMPCLSVDDHIASDTGLLDVNGDPIMRAPRPVGFGRMEEW